MKGVARLVVSIELLKMQLGLPEDTFVLRVKQPDRWDRHGGSIELVIESETLPPNADGSEIPIVSCMVEETEAGPQFMGWV